MKRDAAQLLGDDADPVKEASPRGGGGGGDGCGRGTGNKNNLLSSSSSSSILCSATKKTRAIETIRSTRTTTINVILDWKNNDNRVNSDRTTTTIEYLTTSKASSGSTSNQNPNNNSIRVLPKPLLNEETSIVKEWNLRHCSNLATSKQEGSNSNEGLAISNKPKTPFDLWKIEFESYIVAHGFLGSLLVRGLDGMPHQSHNQHHHHGVGGILPQQDDYWNPDSLSSPPGTPTTMDITTSTLLFLSRENLIQQLRYILITPSRAEKLQQLDQWFFGNGNDDSSSAVVIRTYDQHGTFGRHVYTVWYDWNLRIFRDCRVQSQRLDWLIALTCTLQEWDAWMSDDPECNEDQLSKMIKSISGAWQRLFRRERDDVTVDLGWDRDYTVAGVMELLRQFKEKVEACPALGPFEYSII